MREQREKESDEGVVVSMCMYLYVCMCSRV